MTATVLLLLMAYLLGSVSGSLLLGRLRGIDVRQHGSGNAGGTNALRTLGWRMALGVVLIDVGKGVLAAVATLWLAPEDGPLVPQTLALAGVLLAVAGHTWPVFHGFRGGKGAATLVGGLAVLWPVVIAPLLLVWVLCIVLTGYVGLATMLAATSLVPLAAWVAPAPAYLPFAVAAAVFIVFTHRANLSRLLAGDENRFERARLLHRWWRGRRA